MNTFTLLHGSKQIVEVPDLAFGNDYNDYGRGFYCAKVEAMAKHRRYISLLGGSAVTLKTCWKIP